MYHFGHILLFILVSFFSCIPARAEPREFSGLIFREDRLYLEIENGQRVPLTTFAASVQETLYRLYTGDGIKLSGEEVDGGILCTQIQFVHIKRILGVWEGSDSTLLVIRNFQQINRWKNPRLPKNQRRREVFSYNMTPDSPGRWGILMVGEGQVISGFVEFKTNNLIFEFTDKYGTNQKVKYRRRSI